MRKLLNVDLEAVAGGSALADAIADKKAQIYNGVYGKTAQFQYRVELAQTKHPRVAPSNQTLGTVQPVADANQTFHSATSRTGQ